MKICIVGLPQSGKSSLFSALTGASAEPALAKGTDPIAVVRVPDPRLEKLAAIFEPKKKTAASIEFIELRGIPAGDAKHAGTVAQLSEQLRKAVQESFPPSGQTPELGPQMWAPDLTAP